MPKALRAGGDRIGMVLDNRINYSAQVVIKMLEILGVQAVCLPPRYVVNPRNPDPPYAIIYTEQETAE